MDTDTDRWSRIKDGLAEAESVEPAQRDGFLQALPADIRAEVAQLLGAGDASGLLDEPILDPALTLAAVRGGTGGAHGVGAEPVHAVLGTRIGPYQVVDLLGRGGMGDVYRARRADGLFEREVALKLVRTDVNRAGLLARFDGERRILASLTHPGISRVLAAGTAEDGPAAGRPWLAMEIVEGLPLTEFVAAHRPPVEDRVRLLIAVAEAVHHAHQKLVVHRDLKPSNVLVSETPDGPRATLLDFGVAKILDPDGGVDLTSDGASRPMTRTYAAPEQVRGEPASTATDVYALGLLLFEVLADARPFPDTAGPLALEHAILHEDPPRPSDVTGAAGAPPRALRGDLDAICLRALAKAPEQRYPSAAALAADLRRHLDGVPVEARPATAAYRARRFARRHRGTVAVGALLAVVLVGGAAATLWQAAQARRAAAESEAAAVFLADLLGAPDPLAADRRDTLRVGDLLDEGAVRIREELADQPRLQARLLSVLGATYRGAERWTESEAVLVDAVARYRRVGAPPAALGLALGELAATRTALGRHDDAVPLAREALALIRRSGDPAHLARAEQTLGRALLRSATPAGADSLFRSAHDRLRALGGPPDVRLALLERDLGHAALDAGRADEARDHAQTAIAGVRALVGDAHPLLVGLYQDLSVAHLFAQRNAESEAAAARGVAVARALGPSMRLGNALTVHGQALRRLGRLDEAEAALREAVPLVNRRPEDRALPLGSLASVLDDAGDLPGALAAQAESYRLLRAASQPNAMVTVSSAVKLAGLLTRSGRFADAEVRLREADRSLAGGGVDSLAGRVARGQIAGAYADLYTAWGRPADAARARRSAPAATGHGATR